MKRGLTVNAGVIAGGTRSNVVAAECRCEVDVRIAKASDAARVDRMFRGLKVTDKACRLMVEGGINRPPMERKAGTVALFRQARRLAAEMGFVLEEAATGGGSDGNFTAGTETLAPFLAHLPRDRRIIALDILSATPAAGALDVTQASLAMLIGHFLQAIGMDRPVLIGHSHGGALALRLASDAPAKFPGLVLLSPAHPFGGYRPHVVNFYLTRWGRFLALSIPLAPSWMILRAYNQAAGPTTPITMQQLRPYLRILRDRDALRRVLQMLHCWEDDMNQLSTALLAAPLRQPVLLVWGEHDVIVPPESATALLSALPTSQLITLAGRGHLLPDEAADDCAAYIEQWLFDQQIP